MTKSYSTKLNAQEPQKTLNTSVPSLQALREGSWILLDEVNLAPPETLERLTGVLNGEAGSISLTERGDIEPVRVIKVIHRVPPTYDVA